MRTILALATFLVACCSTTAFAGIPDPGRNGCALKGQGAACQYRFRADGGLDRMTVCVTLRDPFDQPVPDCETRAGINLLGSKLGGGPCAYTSEFGSAFCTCCPNPQTGVTDSLGVVDFVFSKIGGRGRAEVCVTAQCVGAIAICCLPFRFSSPDMNASCNAPPSSATNVIDLGIWAGCLPPAPACESSDYNCSCSVTVLDLGLFAGGLGVPCNGAVCP